MDNPPPSSRDPLKYLAAYPDHLQAQVYELIEQGRLGTILADKYGQSHTVRSDSKLQVMKHALGTHTAISRIQGDKLKASR